MSVAGIVLKYGESYIDSMQKLTQAWHPCFPGTRKRDQQIRGRSKRKKGKIDSDMRMVKYGIRTKGAKF